MSGGKSVKRVRLYDGKSLKTLYDKENGFTYPYDKYNVKKTK